MKTYQLYGHSWVRESIERGQFPARFGGKTVTVTPDRAVTSEDGIRRGEVAEHVVIYELDGKYGYEVWRLREWDGYWYDVVRCVCIPCGDLERDTKKQATAMAEEGAKSW